MLRQFGSRVAGTNYVDRPGVYAVIENDERRIAVIETGRGCFLPGGGMDAGETEAAALERELLEETGYRASSLTEIGEAVEYVKAHDAETHYRIHSKFYRVQLGSKAGKGVEKDHRLVWLQPEDAIKQLTRQGQAWAVRYGTGTGGEIER